MERGLNQLQQTTDDSFPRNTLTAAPLYLQPLMLRSSFRLLLPSSRPALALSTTFRPLAYSPRIYRPILQTVNMSGVTPVSAAGACPRMLITPLFFFSFSAPHVVVG